MARSAPFCHLVAENEDPRRWLIFWLYGNVRTWHGHIQELKGGFNRGYVEVIELPTESPSPLLHCHTPQPPCESMQDVIPLQNQKLP